MSIVVQTTYLYITVLSVLTQVDTDRAPYSVGGTVGVRNNRFGAFISYELRKKKIVYQFQIYDNL